MRGIGLFCVMRYWLYETDSSSDVTEGMSWRASIFVNSSEGTYRRNEVTLVMIFTNYSQIKNISLNIKFPPVIIYLYIYRIC